jgi:hypothetical protein
MYFSKTMGSITGIDNLLTGQNTVLRNDYPIWEFSTSNGSYSASDNNFTYKISAETLMMRWGLGNQLAVSVAVSQDAINGGIDLNLNITNLSSLTIDSVDFPYIAGFTTLSNSSKSDSLAVPSRDGLVIPDFQQSLGQMPTLRLEYTGSLSMQFFLIYDNAVGGIYEGAQDPSSTYKALEIQDFTFSSQAFKFYWALYPSEISSGNQFNMNYSVSIASFRGASWEDGASLYSSWALNQQYISQGTLQDRTDIPSWFKNVGQVWPTGPPYSQSQARNLVGGPNQTVLFDLWGWNLYGFDSGYGNYFPPAGGASSLTNYTAMVNNQGDYATMFFSATLVDTNSTTDPSFSNEEQYMIVNQQGQLYTENLPNKVVMAEPDPTSAFWQDQLVNYSETAVGVYGADGVYLDGLALAPVELNYRNPGNVTLSGPTFWEAYAGILENMSNAMKKYISDPIITAEGENEVYIPYLSAFWDNMDQDNPANTGIQGAVETPIFSYVYHEYTLVYGTPYAYAPAGSSYGSPQLFRYTLSKALAFGLIPRPDLPSYINVLSNDSNFLEQAVDLEQGYSGYLRFGQMLPGPIVGASNITYYLGGDNYQTVPVVSDGMFQAANGSEILLVSNPTVQNQNISLGFYDGEFGPNEAVVSVSVCPGGQGTGSCVLTNGSGYVTVDIKAESDAVFRIVPVLQQTSLTTTTTVTTPSTTITNTIPATTISGSKSSSTVTTQNQVGQSQLLTYVVPVAGAILITGAAVLAFRMKRRK